MKSFIFTFTNKVLLVAFVFVTIVFNSCEKPDIEATETCTYGFTDTSYKHPKNVAFQNVIAKYVKAGLPGISVLIEDSNGVWVGSGGSADIAKNIAFEPCNISKAASITKLLVGTLTLKLQEEGKIDIDDLISKYIDDKILRKIKNAEGKTIRQLMNHTTGIFDVITSSNFYLAVLNNPNKEWKQEELLAFVYGESGVELGKPYNSSYSNTNTLLLSMCIDKATGSPHETLLRDKILNPLGMTNTYYQGREEVPNQAAQGYFDLYNNGTLVNVSNYITGSGNGYGGIFSNVFDLHKFIKALLVDKTILTQQSLNTMQEFVQEDADFYTGIGTIKKFTKKSAFGIGHTGRDLGYVADLFYFPQRNTTLVFFVNYGTNGNSSLKPIFLDFESELVDEMLK